MSVDLIHSRCQREPQWNNQATWEGSERLDHPRILHANKIQMDREPAKALPASIPHVVIHSHYVLKINKKTITHVI